MEHGRSQGTIKNPRPFLDDIEGTRVSGLFISAPRNASNCIPGTHPWCHPNCLSFFLSISDEMPHAGDALLYRDVAKVERPLFPGYVLHGNHPSVPTCPSRDIQTSILTKGFLRSATHEGVLRCASIPNFHSASDRCRPPISYSVRSTRVRLVYLDTNRCALMFYCN